ncbi:MAG: leucine-rich repeat protein [Clostridiales bacterium]|jgi:uncharacterized repeat protein (TIGR02543 family)|nr:leucine-rich repeat protein [Clostridiales bacterium]
MAKKRLLIATLLTAVIALALSACGGGGSKKFTVTFDSREGTAVAAYTELDSGATIEAPAVPTREGYIFGGWYKDAEYAQSWDFASDTVTADITLYAKWTEGYTVTFDTDGATEVAPQEVSKNGYAEQPEDPVKEGYKMIAWYSDEEFEYEWDFEFDPITANTTLYARLVLVYEYEEVLWSEVFSGTAFSYDYVVGVAVTKYTGTDTVVKFPSQINGYDVIRIGKKYPTSGAPNDAGYAWGVLGGSNAEVTEVILPDTVRHIDQYAFARRNIKFNLPKNLRRVEANAFKGNEVIEEIVFPASLEYADTYAFRDLPSLKRIKFEDGSKLNRLYLEGGQTSDEIPIEEIDFGRGSSLTRLDLMNPVHLKSLTVPAKLQTLSILGATKSLESVSVEAPIPTEAEPNPAANFTVQDGVLYSADMSTLYIYPAGLTAQTFNVPSGVTKIIGNGIYAPALKVLNLPATTVDVDTYGNPLIGGDLAFYYLDSVGQINVHADNTAFKSVDGVLYSKDGSDLIKVPAKKTFTDNEFVLPAAVDKVFRYALKGSGATKISLADTALTAAQAKAFAGMTELKEVIFKEGITSIAYEAFDGDGRLDTVTFPGTLSTIGESAFRNTAFTAVTLPAGVTSVGATAFAGAPVETVTVLRTASTTSISYDAFSARPAGGFITVYVPAEKVDDYAAAIYLNASNVVFATGTEIESNENYLYAAEGTGPNVAITIIDYKGSSLEVAIPETIDGKPVAKILKNAFKDKGLTSVTLPSSLKQIGADAFSGNAITSLTLPSGLVKIGANAFYNNRITSLIIPASVTEIGAAAFAIDTLTSVTFAADSALATLNLGAFADNTHYAKITAITVPAGVTAITFNNYLMSLQAINIEAGNTVYSSVEGVVLSADGTTLIRYPRGKAVDEYTTPGTVTTIGDSAFYGARIGKLVLAEGVTNFSANSVTVFGYTTIEKLIFPSTLQTPVNSARMLFSAAKIQGLYIKNSANVIAFGGVGTQLYTGGIIEAVYVPAGLVDAYRNVDSTYLWSRIVDDKIFALPENY